jgi:hypothetical protein
VLRVATYRPPALDLYKLGPAERLRVHVRRLQYCVQRSRSSTSSRAAVVPELRGLRALRLLRLMPHQLSVRYIVSAIVCT